MVVTLDSIIRSVMVDLNEDEARYFQYLHWGLEALTDYTIDQSRSIKTKELKVSPYKTSDVPKDCVSIVNLGIKMDDRLWVFRYDESLWNRGPGDTTLPARPVSSGEDLPVFTPNYYLSNFINDYGENLGRLYGYSVQREHIPGYFRLINKCTQIQFNQSVLTNGDKVYLEYVSDGITEDGTNLVDKQTAKAIKLYIHWMRLEYSRTETNASKNRAKALYEAEVRKVSWRNSNFTIEDLQEILEERYSLAPKMY